MRYLVFLFFLFPCVALADDIPPPPNYEAEEQKLWIENSDSVQRLARTGDERIMRKIETYVRRFGGTRETILAKIISDRLFANTFSVRPTRQGLHERLASEWLSQLPMIKDFEVLPKGGPDALYVDDTGKIVRGKPTGLSKYKSIDFRWRTKGYDCYATHKYTGSSGGSQSSAALEVSDTLRRFRNGNASSNTVFFGIVDGAFYNKAWMSNASSIERSTSPLSFITHISGVPVELANLP